MSKTQNAVKKPGKPPRPRVSYPSEWSLAVQQLLTLAELEAMKSLVEKELGEIRGSAWRRASTEMEQKILANPATKREFYELVLHFIPRVTPSNGFSTKGPPVDRAESRLRLWDALYGPGNR